MRTADDGGACPYPVRDYDNATVGPVLSAAEEIDALRAEHPFVRSTFGNGFWTFTNAEMIREALQHPDVFSSSVVAVQDPDPPVQVDPRDARSPGAHDVAPAAGTALHPQGDGAARGQGQAALRVADRRICRHRALRLPAGLRLALPDDDLHGAHGAPARRPGAVPRVGASDPPPLGAGRSGAHARHRGDDGRHGVLRRAHRGEASASGRGSPVELARMADRRRTDPDGGPPVVVPAHVHGRSRHRLDPARVRVLVPGRTSRRPHPDRPGPEPSYRPPSRSSFATSPSWRPRARSWRTRTSTAARSRRGTWSSSR